MSVCVRACVYMNIYSRLFHLDKMSRQRMMTQTRIQLHTSCHLPLRFSNHVDDCAVLLNPNRIIGTSFPFGDKYQI